MEKSLLDVESGLLQRLLDKSITKELLLEKVKQDFRLLPLILEGLSSHKAAIRYGCAKVLLDLSETHPKSLYLHMDSFISLLDSKYRILTWNAMGIIANLAKVDEERRFDLIFDKYFSFINDEYMVTVANVVGNSWKFAIAKPHLIEDITDELLRVESISTSPHLSEECKRVIAEKTIKSFDRFFDNIKNKRKVLAFVQGYRDSSRGSLRKTAESFIEEWG